MLHLLSFNLELMQSLMIAYPYGIAKAIDIL